jgi:hypothetical protein
MTIERDHDRQALAGPRRVDGLSDDGLVSEVDAVKHPNGEVDGARSGCEFGELMKQFQNLHCRVIASRTLKQD